MAFEQYANLASTNLTANYTAGSGVLQVTATTSPWPASPQFRVFVADPTSGTVKVILKVTAITDTTHWAVTAEGSDANATSGDVVKLCLTAGAMDQIRIDTHQTGALASAVSQKAGNLYLPNNALTILRDTGAAFSPWGPIWPLSDPNLQSWTQQNFGSCTSSSAHGGINIVNPTAEGSFNTHALVKSAPSTPYHCEFGFFKRMLSGGNEMAGACFSDGTKYEIFDQYFQNSLAQAVVFYLTNSTTFGGTPVNTNPGGAIGAMIWARLGDDGTNKTWDISCDGYTWYQVGSEAHATNMTPTQVGIYVNHGPAQVTLLHYKETT